VTASAALSEIRLTKAADETVTSSDTLQDDDDLAFDVGADQLWLVEFFLLVFGASATPDLKFTIQAPAGATGHKGNTGGGTNVGLVAPSSGNTVGGIETLTTNLTAGTNNVDAAVHQWVSIATAALAGRVKLRWSQNTSSSDVVTLRAGSSLIAWRLA